MRPALNRPRPESLAERRARYTQQLLEAGVRIEPFGQAWHLIQGQYIVSISDIAYLDRQDRVALGIRSAD